MKKLLLLISGIVLIAAAVLVPMIILRDLFWHGYFYLGVFFAGVLCACGGIMIGCSITKKHVKTTDNAAGQ